MDSLNFTDKVVIVTGASSGIGAATAKRFAKFNAKLTLVGRNAQRMERVAMECKKQNGLTPLCILVDLIQKGSCEKVVNKTVEMYGTIDVLVNCAGTALVSSIFEESLAIFDELMALHVRVPYYLTQLSLPHLIKTKGNVVNVSSSGLERYLPGFLTVLMSKQALTTFSQHAAVELASEGVRMNVISPGLTRTNIMDCFDLEKDVQSILYEEFDETMPLGKVLEASEVATMICMAASDQFPNLNGADLHVDGAMTFS